MSRNEITSGTVEDRMEQILKEAEEGGYLLNPDTEFVRSLVRGLMVNEERYGYPSCPCRLSAGRRGDDLDIICPCDYRDPDLEDYEACYCALYVSPAVVEGSAVVGSIPERRPPRGERGQYSQKEGVSGLTALQLPFPVWRCRVCGYLCARESPPLVCPVCKVKQDRFERFL